LFFRKNIENPKPPFQGKVPFEGYLIPTGVGLSGYRLTG